MEVGLSLALVYPHVPVSFVRENRNLNHLRFGGAAAAIIDPHVTLTEQPKTNQ